MSRWLGRIQGERPISGAAGAVRAGRIARGTAAAVAVAALPVLALAAPAAIAQPAVTSHALAKAVPGAVPGPPSGWTTQFSDDFNGPAGSGVDSQWQYDT